MSATTEIFPNVELKLCWFNFIRVSARKWKTFGLNDLNDEILQYTFVIPTLPANQFKNSIEEIEAMIDDNEEKYRACIEKLQSFIKFIKLWWQSTAESISFSNNMNNSINISEYFDRHLGSKMGSLLPDIFLFFDKTNWLKIMLPTIANLEANVHNPG
ncbi:hypothetical protein KQX54_013720 [Cotesia glomerata]|uniref:Uncharacterized protein n=1 Tax=Cotesia glomerata TaxID=32391 RepID=A0AAV7IEQ5_COTGL|nr:hypothetical protein KQX54_013720 [Cotesia glomerata]